MRSKLNIVSGLILIGLIVYFLFSVMQVFLPTVGKNVVICNNCLGLIIPSFLGKSALLLVAISLASLCISLLRANLFLRTLATIKGKPRIVSKIEGKYSLQKKIVLFKHQKPLAFCLGYVSPKIYLSSQLFKLMTHSEIEAVILHEQQHIIGNDNLKLSILYMVKSTFFFFPIIGDLVNNIELKQEIQADDKTIQIIGEKSALVTALRKVIEASSLSLAFAKNFYQNFELQPRINYLIKGGDVKFHLKVQNVIFTLGAIFLFLNILVGRIETHPILKTDAVLCLDKGNCQNFCNLNSL